MKTFKEQHPVGHCSRIMPVWLSADQYLTGLVVRYLLTMRATLNVIA